MSKKIIVSACLLEVNCKHNGGNNKHEKVIQFVKGKDYISICPEMLGGLSCPRASAEIRNNSVVTNKGEDVTKSFHLGVKLTLERLQKEDVEVVILQARSPSCGCGLINDGTFQKKLIEGNGVCAQLLLDHGYPVLSSDTL